VEKWAEQSYQALQAEAARRGTTIARLFNQARSADPDNKRYTAEQWRALYRLILQKGGK
jgi:hypothetical protein